MAYTNVWDETAPLGSQAANLIDDDIRSFKLDVRQRLESIFGVGIFTTDPVSIPQLKFTAANSKLIPGATTFLFRDAADANSNITIADGGAVNINRGLFTAAAGIQVNNGGISVSSGGITITAGGLSVGGNTTIQNGAGPTFLFITNGAGQDRRIKFQTGGVDRFTIGIGSGAESGGNAGSDILFRCLDDAGATVADFLTVVRATGVSTFAKPVVISVTTSLPLELKSLSTSNNRLLRLTNTEASGYQYDLIVGTVAAGSDFRIFDVPDNRTLLQIFPSGVMNIGTTGVGNTQTVLSINKDNAAAQGVWVNFTRGGVQKAGIGLDVNDNLVFGTGNLSSATLTLNSGNGLISGSVYDSAFGYRIGNGATAGRFLRGDGTNFVSSTIQSSDFPVQDCARAYRTTTLDLVVTTLTPIGFDAEDFDSNNLHDNVTNNTRLTAPSAGKYLVTAHISWSGAASNVFVVIRKNGVATDLAKTSKNVTSSSVEVTEINVILVLSATDYVEVYGQNDTAVNPDIIAGIERTYFQMTRISS